jgi:hypothetical protein
LIRKESSENTIGSSLDDRFATASDVGSNPGGSREIFLNNRPETGFKCIVFVKSSNEAQGVFDYLNRNLNITRFKFKLVY